MRKQVETRPEALKRQQIILAHLGYYKGKIDGTWAPGSYAAMRAFELSGKYNPGIPSGGQPLNMFERMPAGVFIDGTRPGESLLSCTGLTDEKISEILKAQGVREETPSDVTEPDTDNNTDANVSNSEPDTDNNTDANVSNETPSDPAPQADRQIDLSSLDPSNTENLTKKQKKLLARQQNQQA